MKLYDLTASFPANYQSEHIRLTEVPLQSAKTKYTGLIYDSELYSMNSSYIDLPGHIRETDDGVTAENAPIQDFYRVNCSLIRLHREDQSGAVTAQDLENAFGGKVTTPALMINALGKLEPGDIECRSVYLDDSAVEWIISCGVRLLVSDIYESQALEGVFLKLFAAGVSTVCEPRRMIQVSDREFYLSIIFMNMPYVTQIPCRILAECNN